MTSHPPGRAPRSSAPVWIVSSGVVVVAVVATLIVVVRSGGDGDSRAGGTAPASPSASAGSPVAPSPGGGSATATSTSTSPSAGGVGGSGTALPTAATSAVPAAGYTDGNCPPGEGAAYAVIDLTSATTAVEPGDSLGGSVMDTLAACATDTVRPRLSDLYGELFGAPGTDLTGGTGSGPVARYRMVSSSGGILTITVVKTTDNRYVCTDFAYQRD